MASRHNTALDFTHKQAFRKCGHKTWKCPLYVTLLYPLSFPISNKMNPSLVLSRSAKVEAASHVTTTTFSGNDPSKDLWSADLAGEATFKKCD